MISERKVAVVTGGSAGVGRATAIAFAERGFDVAVLARGTAGLAASVGDVEVHGARGLAVSADIASFDEVDAAADRIECELGPIDVWVNDAMTTVFASLADMSPVDFRRAVEVTFLGQVWGTMAALRRMRPRDRGSIVNVGSALAFVGIPLQSAYCGSKFACRGFFESARSELLHEDSHVRLSMVHLPAVNTPQFEWCKTVFSRHPQPVAPIYQPELCAQRIVEVALTGERERIVGAWNRLLVLANSVVPGFGNQFAARGAWDQQLAPWAVQANRQANLDEPADETVDFGAHGTFDDQALGCWTPSFLRSLPKVGIDVLRAGLAVGAEHVEVFRQSRSVRST